MRFKLKFKEKRGYVKNYDIYFNLVHIGEIDFRILVGELHITNVFIDDDYKGKVGFGDWLRTFENIFVYDALPNSIFYWTRRGATIISETKFLTFEDIIFENIKTEEEDE